MESTVLPVTIRGLIPTSNGVAVFLGNDLKLFVIYVDPAVGQALSMAINKVEKPRPLTHDLMHNLFRGMGISLQGITINDVDRDKFFARLLLRMENELGIKVIECDARPSDAMVLAVLQQKPIYVNREVLDRVDDMTEVFEKIRRQREEEEDQDL